MFSLRLRSENERKGNKINAGKSIGSDANFPSIRLGLVKFVIAKPAIFRCYQNSCNFLLNSCKLVFISVHGKSIPGRRHKHTHTMISVELAAHFTLHKHHTNLSEGNFLRVNFIVLHFRCDA